MNPIRKLLIKWGLLPLTPADLTALLDRAQDKTLPIRARWEAWLDHATLTTSPEQLEALLERVTNPNMAVPARPIDTNRVVS